MNPALRVAYLAVIILLGGASTYGGQVVVDNSFGHPGTLTGPNFSIPSALGRQAGANLFHSFSNFDLDSGEVATFLASGSTQNILVRVTGGSPSGINGTIATRLESNTSSPHPASFYFINPSGVVFGPDARLDLGGSFAVTTADVVRLADGGAFHASAPASSVLSSAAPPAFGFLTKPPVGVVMVGTSAASPVGLGVAPGKSISVVAGPVQIVNGVLFAPAGRVAIAAVAEPGDVKIDATGAVNLTSTPAPADINLSGATISVDGAPSGNIALRGASVSLDDSSFVASTNSGQGAGGAIAISASNALTVQHGSLITTGSQGSGAAGGITLDADHIILGVADTADVTSVASTTGSAANAAGGPVQLHARSVELHGSSDLGSSTSGVAPAADVLLSADTISLADESGIRSSTTGAGASGAINIQGGQLQLAGNSRVVTSTSGSGPGGLIQVAATGVQTTGTATIFSVTNGPARGGDVVVSADEIDLLGAESGIQTTTLAAQNGGKGGDLTLNGKSLRIEGGATASVVSNNDAGGGNLNVNVDQIFLSGTGSSIQDAPLFGTGGGGSLTIKASTLDLEDQSRVATSAFGAADGGPISISADQVLVRGGSEISAGAGFAGTGTGNAGPINLVARTPTLDGNSDVTSTSDGFGAGGKISVTVSQMALTNNSAVSASSSSAGNGGSVVVQAGTIDLRGGSDLLAFTTGAGNGGDITINATSIFASDAGSGIRAPTAVIDGQGRSGNGGNVHVVVQNLTLQNSASIVTSTGAARSDGSIDNANSTDVTGRAGNIDIQARRMRLTGGTADNPSGISAQTTILTPGTGAGGDIRIVARDLRVLEGARINGSSTGSAAGGSININGRGVIVNGLRSVIKSEATGSGNAGSIRIDAARRFLVSRKGNVGVSALTAEGGDLSITAGDSLVVSNGILTAESGGVGGNIDLRAGRLIQLTGSTVTARAGTDGGRVRIDPPVFALKNSTIDARAGGTPVSVESHASAFLNSDSRILTNTGFVLPEADIAGSLLALCAATIVGPTKLEPSCGARFTGEVSSFVVTGRGGEPPEPGAWVPDLSLKPMP